MNNERILGICITIVIGLSLLICAFLLNGNKEDNNKGNPPSKEIQEKPDEIIEKTEEDSYAKLLGLDYDLLRVDKTVEYGLDISLYMDIQVENQLSEEQFIELGKEVYNVLTTDVKNKENITSIYLNAFTNKDAYEDSKKEDYGEGNVDGLVQTFNSSHIEGNKANVKTYKVIQSPLGVIPIADSLDFEVKDANISIDKKIVDTAIILSTGTTIQLENMVKSLVEMIKESNKGSEQISIRIYNSNENYEIGKIKYEYSTLQPSVLLEQTNITF